MKPAVPRLYMRTSKEAHVYMDQRPCACGDVAFDRQSAVMTDGQVLCSRYFGKCRTCETMREFIFELPKVQRPIGHQVELGGAEPSRLLDAGEWMGISQHYAKLVPGTPDDLDMARAALEEVIKFVPNGAESVPENAFWTERGRAVRDREPGRFRRARLAAVLDAYLASLAKQDLTQIAVAWKHTGDAELPYTADVRGRRFTIRINDFPAEPLYTLIAEGNELQDLEDWPPAWVMPTPPKALLDLLNPKKPTCSICGSIGDVARANTGRDEHFEPPITSLKRNDIDSYDDLWECPECDAVFLWREYTAQTGSGNNDEDVLTRLPSEQASFIRTFLHRGERRAEDVAQSAGRLLELADRARDLLLSHLVRHDRDLAARLVPWMLEEISRTGDASLAWADDFVRRFMGESKDPIEHWDAFESALAKMTNDDAWGELERVIEKLTKKEAWKGLEKVIRSALRLITGFAGPQIGAREKAHIEHDLWKRLGLLYGDRLDAKESAVTALEMAVSYRADDDETQLALAALHEKAERFEQAIRCNEIAVRTRPRRIDGYRNLFRIHSQRVAHDAAWCAASALAFLEHRGPEVDFHARHAPPTAPSLSGDLEETSWVLLRHEDESDVITNVFRVLAPVAARLADAEKRARSGVDRWFGPTSRMAPAELAFMAGRNAAYGRPPLRSLFSDHAAISELEDLFMAGLRAVWLDAWRSPPVFSERAVERAAELARFLEPSELVALRTATTAVRKQGSVDVVKWANGVELTAARAGLLFSGDLVTAERALQQLGEAGGLTVDEKMNDLLAFAASEKYVSLRKQLGRAIDVTAGDKPGVEPRARTLVEMRFAASLRPCTTCGAPTPENLELHGSNDSWSLTGKCLYCGTDRKLDFSTAGDPLKGKYARGELGDGGSQVIRAHEFLAELERLSLLVPERPRQLTPAEWQTSTRAVDRAITCALELLKLGPENAEAIASERDRLLATHARLRAEIPRVWELMGRRLGLADEIRGLLNQVSKQRVPAAADLREYFASRKVRSLTKAGPDRLRPPWATKVNGADDLFVELDSNCVTGVHVWDDSGGLGAYAALFVREGRLDDVKDGILHVCNDARPPAHVYVEDHRVGLSAEHDPGGSAVVVVTFLFERFEQSPPTTAVPPEVLPALLDPAGPPLTVGALESALGMQLGTVVLHASGLGSLSATNISARYGWHFTEQRVRAMEDLRARDLVEWSATFAQGSTAADAGMRDRFGSPRELPSGRGRVFGPFILAPAAGGQACTLSWYAKLPDWAVPPFDAGLRERALFELVAALTKAEAIADVTRALSSLPDSCGLVHHPASASEGNGHIEFVPPIRANDLARIVGWRDAVGKTFDMHMQNWVVCIVTGQGEFRLETTSPTIGNWVVSATLDRRPTGGEWKRSPPVSNAFGLPWQSDAYLFGPTDVVRFLNFRVPIR